MPAELSALPFEKAMAELEQIVGRLEKGDATLEESILVDSLAERAGLFAGILAALG